MQPETTRPASGIHVASGYGLKIFGNRGHLVVHEGVGVDRETRRFSRATSGLERLVVVGHTGFVTLEALRWIRDVGAAFVQIDRDGQVIALSSAERFHNTKLRRAQVKAADGPLALELMRRLVAAKIRQQAERVAYLRQLWPPKPNGGAGQVEVGRVLQDQLQALEGCSTLPELRAKEAVAGRWYWQTLAGRPVRFHSSWRERIPEHWLIAGARTSPPSGFKSSRKAASPFHALVNYAYAILETEASIVLQAFGLDPSLGLMHTDKRYRGSLAHDLIEPVRPVADGLVLGLVDAHELRRGDVYETREGVCRLGPPLIRRLAAGGPMFWDALADHARELVVALLGGTSSRAARPARQRHAHTAGKGATRRAVPRVAATK